MERTEIIKALEFCSSGGNCNKCSEDAKNPRLSREGCMALQMRNALSLINELTAENEKLTINMNAYGLTAKRLAEENEIFATHHKAACEAVKIDTVLKMQEMFDNRVKDKLAYHGWYLKETIMPSIAKEMLDES